MAVAPCGCDKGKAVAVNAAGPRILEAARSMPDGSLVDGRSYPLQAWPVCPGSDDPWYVLGTDNGWQRAQVLASQRGCGFDPSRVILMGPPSVGRWVA